jgi:hypothetical protein
LYHKPSLLEAAAALIEIDEAGELFELRDELEWQRQEWRDPDRRWRTNSPINGYAMLAGELSKMTGAPVDECRDAITAASGDDWPTVACAEIVARAKRLRSSRANPSAPTIAPQSRRKVVA